MIFCKNGFVDEFDNAIVSIEWNTVDTITVEENTVKVKCFDGAFHVVEFSGNRSAKSNLKKIIAAWSIWAIEKLGGEIV